MQDWQPFQSRMNRIFFAKRYAAIDDGGLSLFDHEACNTKRRYDAVVYRSGQCSLARRGCGLRCGCLKDEKAVSQQGVRSETAAALLF